MNDNFKRNQKLFYGTLKQLRKGKEFTMIDIKDKNGEIITREDETMWRWREHFQELTKTEKEPALEYAGNTQDIQEITEEALGEAIDKMKLGSAAAIDNITSEMIRYLPVEGTNELPEIMNMEIKNKKVPTDWKTGIILPIYKSGAKRKCRNYRGITLSSIPGKLLARVIEGRLRKKLNNTVDDTQCGFRKEKHTRSNLYNPTSN